MEIILSQIDHALKVRLYYLAVTASLTLPDICAALESRDGESKGSRYKAWCNTWAARRFDLMDGDIMWALRNGVVHQGVLSKKSKRYDRIIFTIHGGIHNCISEGNAGIAESALTLDATTFCRDMIASVQEWYEAKKDDEAVVANLPRLLQFRPGGVMPHFFNVPVIA